MKKYIVVMSALVALFLLPQAARADFVSGTVLVAKSFPGARDNPLCYVPLTSTSDPTKTIGPPCKTIQYACNLAMTNPGGHGPGPTATLAQAAAGLNPTGAGGWRLLFGSPTAANYPDIYVENVVCPASGFFDANGVLFPFRIIAHSGSTRLHAPVGSTLPALTLNGDNMFFGKIDFFGISTAKGEALHIGETSPSTKRHSNITVYYDTLYTNTWSTALHIYNIDGIAANNSAIQMAGGDGGPCIKIENSTRVHLDTDSVARCGTQFGAPTVPTNGIEIYNSPGFFIGTMLRPNPPYTAQDLYVGSASPNSIFMNNDKVGEPYKCKVPAADLATDSFTGTAVCSTY